MELPAIKIVLGGLDGGGAGHEFGPDAAGWIVIIELQTLALAGVLGQKWLERQAGRAVYKLILIALMTFVIFKFNKILIVAIETSVQLFIDREFIEVCTCTTLAAGLGLVGAEEGCELIR